MGVKIADFNSYGARRGNHHVMVRGTFANVRVRNLMVPGTEGGVTVHQPDGSAMSIHEAALAYAHEAGPLGILAGRSTAPAPRATGRPRGRPCSVSGGGGPLLRAHPPLEPRRNGVCPCQFPDGVSAQSLGLDGTETFDLLDVEGVVRPRQLARLVIHRKGGRTEEVKVTVRIDTPIEAEYHRHGGILPYVLRRIVA